MCYNIITILWYIFIIFFCFPDKRPPKDWPSKGQIVFHQFCLYYSPNTPYILKNINVKIDPLEKVI